MTRLYVGMDRRVCLTNVVGGAPPEEIEAYDDDEDDGHVMRSVGVKGVKQCCHVSMNVGVVMSGAAVVPSSSPPPVAPLFHGDDEGAATTAADGVVGLFVAFSFPSWWWGYAAGTATSSEPFVRR